MILECAKKSPPHLRHPIDRCERSFFPVAKTCLDQARLGYEPDLVIGLDAAA